MKIAISVGALQRTNPIEDLVARAAAAGFKAVELGMGLDGPIACDTSQTDCRRIGECVRQAGLAVSALAAEPAVVLDPVSPETPYGRDAGRRLTAVMERARWLGARAIILEAAPRPRRSAAGAGVRWETAQAAALGLLLDARFEAEQRAVCIACGIDWLPCDASPIAVRRFIDEVNSPWVGACLDLSGTASASLTDWLSLLGHRISQVCCTDSGPAAAEGTTPAIDGIESLDWPTTVASLQRIRYAGPITCRAAGDFAAAKARLDAVLCPACTDRRSVLPLRPPASVPDGW